MSESQPDVRSPRGNAHVVHTSKPEKVLYPLGDSGLPQNEGEPVGESLSGRIS